MAWAMCEGCDRLQHWRARAGARLKDRSCDRCKGPLKKAQKPCAICVGYPHSVNDLVKLRAPVTLLEHDGRGDEVELRAGAIVCTHHSTPDGLHVWRELADPLWQVMDRSSGPACAHSGGEAIA
jgi:hypothetical protein